MIVKIFHNPRCSKSRQTLQLLRDQGQEPEVLEYLKVPLDTATLDRILELLNLQPRELMRTNENVYHEQNLADPSLTRAELLQAMVDHPILIQRPIVIVNDQAAAIGRPPEAVLELLV